MHMVVCIKQVPDIMNVGIDPDTHTLVRQGVESIINPFDLFAVEAALKIKDQSGASVTVITMGPHRGADSLYGGRHIRRRSAPRWNAGIPGYRRRKQGPARSDF